MTAKGEHMTTDTDLEWFDEPPLSEGGGRPRGERAAFVERLKEQPGKWAKWPVRISQSSTTQNRRAYPGTEWTARDVKNGKGDLYGRWVGEA